MSTLPLPSAGAWGEFSITAPQRLPRSAHGWSRRLLKLTECKWAERRPPYPCESVSIRVRMPLPGFLICVISVNLWRPSSFGERQRATDSHRFAQIRRQRQPRTRCPVLYRPSPLSIRVRMPLPLEGRAERSGARRQGLQVITIMAVLTTRVHPCRCAVAVGGGGVRFGGDGFPLRWDGCQGGAVRLTGGVTAGAERRSRSAPEV